MSSILKHKKLLHLPLDKAFISAFLMTLTFIAVLRLSQISYNILLVSLILFLFSFYLIRSEKLGSYPYGILYAVACIVIIFFLYETYKTLFTINEWDFLCFYLYGKLGTLGLNFYEPANIANIYHALEIRSEMSQEFLESVLNVGFIYPPVTMFWFAPLGLLDLETANILWKIFVLVFLFLDIILLIKMFKVDVSRGIQIATVITLVLIFPGTLSTTYFWQTNFILLFFLLLSFKNIDNWKSGLFLALAITIKPVAAIWCLYLLIHKKWSGLISLALTGFLLLIISGILFGFDNYISYFTSSPALRVPQWVFSESVNQSLFATISRLFIKYSINPFFGINSIVLILSGILTILTCVASYKLAKADKVLSFLIFIPLSLIIYPGTLIHYSVLLIPVFFEILSVRNYKGLQFLTAMVICLFLTQFIESYMASLCLLLIILGYSFFLKKESPQII